jgi:hypothetical protein
MTPVWTRLRKNGSHLSHLRNKKTKILHSLICLSVQHPLSYAYRPGARSSVAAHPSAPSPTVRSSSYHVVPFPHHRPCRALSLPALLTYAAHLHPSHLRRSLPLRSSPIAVGRVADPAMAAGTHVPWHVMYSPPEQWAPTSVPVLVVFARCGSPSAPTPTGGINWPNLPSFMLHLYISSVSDLLDVCCKCFILMLQK